MEDKGKGKREENEDEIVFEDSDLDDSVVAEESTQESMKKLRTRLKDAEEKAREYLSGWQKERAEIANARKRDEADKKEFAKFAKQAVLEDLIPVLDSFNIALSQGDASLEPIYKQLMQVLKASGLEEVDPLGETFDPRAHEALGMVETDNKSEDHKVLEVLQKGYSLSGRVIRPAKVRVGEYRE